VDVLPRTTVGKIDKVALRERLVSEAETSNVKKGGHGLQG
jgi:acyl-CoA synthetase (AMP-forming)/AMP-acid ligase II